MKQWIGLALLSACGVAVAEYVATGPVEGQVCRGFVIEQCKFYQIDAVKGSDGRLYTMTDRFEKVDEYNSSKRRCWIRTKSTGWGLWSSAANAMLQPDFYRKAESGYEKLDVEYLSFPCVKL